MSARAAEILSRLQHFHWFRGVGCIHGVAGGSPLLVVFIANVTAEAVKQIPSRFEFHETYAFNDSEGGSLHTTLKIVALDVADIKV